MAVVVVAMAFRAFPFSFCSLSLFIPPPSVLLLGIAPPGENDFWRKLVAPVPVLSLEMGAHHTGFYVEGVCV